MLLPLVSVIIPVYNDSEHLQLCLKAIECQTYPNALYEVIVVDNASEENIESVASQFSQAKYTHENQSGSYVARNQGISVSAGEILAFTDSDCIPDSNWIKNGVTHLLSTPNCGLVAGKIEMFFENPDNPTGVELFEKIELNFLQEQTLKNSHYGMTANIFTFKDVINKVGRFDSTLKSGGDREWGQLVFAAGYEQVYADDALVYHPARHSYSQLRKRITRLVGGKFDRMMNKNPSPTEIAKDLVITFKPPFRSLYRAWNNESLNGFHQQVQLISVMFFARYIAISEKMRLYLGGTSQRG